MIIESVAIVVAGVLVGAVIGSVVNIRRLKAEVRSLTERVHCLRSPMEAFFTTLRDSSNDTLKDLARTEGNNNPGENSEAFEAIFQSVHGDSLRPVVWTHLSETKAILEAKGLHWSDHPDMWNALKDTVWGIVSDDIISPQATYKLIKPWLKHYPDPIKYAHRIS